MVSALLQFPMWIFFPNLLTYQFGKFILFCLSICIIIVILTFRHVIFGITLIEQRHNQEYILEGIYDEIIVTLHYVDIEHENIWRRICTDIPTPLLCFCSKDRWTTEFSFYCVVAQSIVQYKCLPAKDGHLV